MANMLASFVIGASIGGLIAATGKHGDSLIVVWGALLAVGLLVRLRR